MNIVLSTDSNYVFQTCITIYSVIKNNSGVRTIYVLASNLTESECKYIENISVGTKIKIVIVNVPEGKIKGKLKSDHLSEATYNRLLMDELLPLEVKRVLYLDSDIVVIGDISKLYYTKSIEEKTAVVVEGFTSKNVDYLKKAIGGYGWKNNTMCGELSKKNVGFKSKEKYFNAGVMLIDLQKMRQNCIGYKCAEAQKKINYFDADQGALNYVLKDEVGYAPMKYNCRPDVYGKKWQWYLRRHSAIFHYSKKPWNDLRVLNGGVWWKYALEFDSKIALQFMWKAVKNLK